ncbi:MAG TPA: hypothetical protein VI386_00695 [Candidatus Sulfotelmatobacter sp.]
MSICLHCAAPMPDDAIFCPGCGDTIPASGKARGIVGVFPENVAGALSYITFIPATAFLLLRPYSKNRFVRFHSLQCLFLWAAMILIAAVLKFAGVILFFIPVLGHLLVFLVSMVVALAAFLVWLVLVIKALQGEAFKLPVVGILAERRAADVRS